MGNPPTTLPPPTPTPTPQAPVQPKPQRLAFWHLHMELPNPLAATGHVERHSHFQCLPKKSQGSDPGNDPTARPRLHVGPLAHRHHHLGRSHTVARHQDPSYRLTQPESRRSQRRVVNRAQKTKCQAHHQLQTKAPNGSPKNTGKKTNKSNKTTNTLNPTATLGLYPSTSSVPRPGAFLPPHALRYSSSGSLAWAEEPRPSHDRRVPGLRLSRERRVACGDIEPRMDPSPTASWAQDLVHPVRWWVLKGNQKATKNGGGFSWGFRSQKPPKVLDNTHPHGHVHSSGILGPGSRKTQGRTTIWVGTHRFWARGSAEQDEGTIVGLV